MSVESDYFKSESMFLRAGAEVTYRLSERTNDAFWAVSLAPDGPNTKIELTRLQSVSDETWSASLLYTIKNNTGEGVFFIRHAVRTPNR